ADGGRGPQREQSQKKEREPSDRRSFSSTSPSHQSDARSARRALPTKLLRGGDTRSSSTQKQKTGQNKENLLLAAEQRRRADKKKAHSANEVRKGASRNQLTGKIQKPVEDWKRHSETRHKGSESVSAGKQSKPLRVKGKPSAGSLSDSQSFNWTTESSQPITEEKKASRSKQKPDLSKKSKDERNRKEADSREETEAQKKSSDLSLLTGAATLAAGGAVLVQQMASRSRVSSPFGSESSRGVPQPGSDPEESESRSAEEISRKSAVSINVIPAAESPQQSQEEAEEENGSGATGQKEEEGWRTSPDISQREEVTVNEEKTEEEEKDSETLQAEDLRLSSSRSKQTDVPSNESPVSGDRAVLGEPPSPGQGTVKPSGARGPRSGACSLL
ncbi:hypothetical protein XENOCAPTIV_019826, partial [Xenoophorus captivus]